MLGLYSTASATVATLRVSISSRPMTDSDCGVSRTGVSVLVAATE